MQNNDNQIKNKEVEANKEESAVKPKPIKPPKPEEKPFNEFIDDHLIPGLKEAFDKLSIILNEIKFYNGSRPVVGGQCSILYIRFNEERNFWLCFNEEKLTSKMTITLSEGNSDPSLLESFLIDERKITLTLIISRILQRLNGQKWLRDN